MNANHQQGDTTMDYETAIRETVSRETAIREIEWHGCDACEFIEDMGDKPFYPGSDVLGWLGY
jgi:hypothetical protein